MNVGAAAVMATHYCWAGAHRAAAGIALISGCQEASMQSRESPKHKLHMYALSQARLPEAQRQPQQPTARMLLACRQYSAHEAARSHTVQQHRVTPVTVISSEHPSHGGSLSPCDISANLCHTWLDNPVHRGSQAACRLQRACHAAAGTATQSPHTCWLGCTITHALPASWCYCTSMLLIQPRSGPTCPEAPLCG